MEKKKIELKGLYKNIIENRFIFSVVMIVISTIIGFFVNNIGIKEWLLTIDKPLCLWCNIKNYSLLLASYELFNIITNKHQKLSFAGAICVTFSAWVQWNITKIDALILGEIITILIYNIVTKTKSKKDYIMILGIIVCSIAYMYTFRPYAISLGYLFFALILWILAENRKKLKQDKRKLITVVFTILFSIMSAIIANTFFGSVYEETNNNLVSGISGLFSYLYDCLIPFNNFEQKAFFASIISIFPLPIIIGLYYLYKNEKNVEFLLPLITISVLEIIYCISGFPEVINKFTMLSEVSSTRVAPAVHLASLFVIFYFVANVKEPLFKLKHIIRITIITVCILVFIQYPMVFATKGFLYLFACELCLLTFLFLNFTDKRYQKVLIFFLVILTLISGIPVNFIA